MTLSKACLTNCFGGPAAPAAERSRQVASSDGMSIPAATAPMDRAEILRAREVFRDRVDSLERDIDRCFWPISDPGAPGAAFFPAVMYCFATLDYYSSFWAGWNRAVQRDQKQTARMTAFAHHYLLYPQKESQIAIAFWRHKLMHTAEPRALRNSLTQELYVWSIGAGEDNHMRLVTTDAPTRLLLHFSPFAFVADLRRGVFGPTGYLQDLETNSALQANYRACLTEFETYEITLDP